MLRVARQMGLEPIMWNVTGYDWNATSAEQHRAEGDEQSSRRDVILLHDGGHQELRRGSFVHGHGDGSADLSIQDRKAMSS